MENSSENKPVNTEGKTELQIHVEEREAEWTNKVKGYADRMRKLDTMRDLQPDIIVARQVAVDYYNRVLRMLAKLNSEYKPLYAQKYNKYKFEVNKMYTSDPSINAQVESELIARVTEINIISNHAQFMRETIKTLDNIYYSFTNRVELEKLLRGF